MKLVCVCLYLWIAGLAKLAKCCTVYVDTVWLQAWAGLFAVNYDPQASTLQFPRNSICQAALSLIFCMKSFNLKKKH